MSHGHNRHAAAVALLTIFGAAMLIVPTAASVIESSWAVKSIQEDWFGSAAWSNGIPNQPGDVAILLRGSSRPAPAELSELATIGELRFTSLVDLTLEGTGSLLFDNLGTEPARLAALGSRSGLVFHVAVPIGIASGQELLLDVNGFSTLRISGGFAPGDGLVRKVGSGVLELIEASPNWDGMVTIDGGDVIVRDATALGSTLGNTVVGLTGTLTVGSRLTVDEPIRLAGGELSALGSFGETVLNGTIELAETSDINSNGVLLLNGKITGPAGVNYSGSNSRFFVFGDNDYDSFTIVELGRVDIRHENGLGSPAQGTVVNPGGNLVLQQSVPEPIALRGGEVLLASAATSTGTIVLESGLLKLPRDAIFTSPLVLANTGGDPIVRGDQTTLTGGITGVGNLITEGSFTVDLQPLEHDGGLFVANGGVALNTANSYTGETHVNGGLAVNHEGALGTSVSPIQVQTNGRLVLNVPITRVIDVEGILEVSDPAIELGQTILLRSMPGSSNTSGIFGQGTFNGEIQIIEDPLSGPFLAGGTFNGVISGNPRVMRISANDSVHLNAANTYRGVTDILFNQGSGLVEVNNPKALGDAEQGTLVRGGRLVINQATNEPLIVTNGGRVDLNVQQPRLPRLALTNTGSGPPASRMQTVSINVPSQYDEYVDVVEGVLEVNADTTVRELVVREHGTLRVTGGNTLQIEANELVLHSGRVEGRIRGVQTLRKITANGAELGDLPGFDGEIVVEKGILQVSSEGALGSSSGATRIGERNGVLNLRVNGSMTYRDDLFLNNSTGIDHTGGLFVNRIGSGGTPTVRLEGNLDLGSVGSVLGSPNSNSTADGVIIELAGPVTGGDLATRGRRLRVRLLSDGNSYTGVTDVRQSTIELEGNGRLTSTSAIVLHEGPRSFDGTLLLNNSLTSVPDRIDDSIPIKFRGGELQATGGTSETLGNLHFIEGDSSVDLTASFNSNDEIRQLRMTAIERQVGATVRVDVSDTAQVHINEPPPMIGGILTWMIVTNHRSSSDHVTGFGTVTEQGIIPITDYETDINQASVFDNVLMDADATMINDNVANSLSFADSKSLDLGGNKLIVNSGGLLMSRSKITNGRITAGAGGQHELIIHNGRIEADIVDNGNQPVSVTTTGGASFSGNNSYSGATFVNENGLGLESETALPDGTDLQIVGGEVNIAYNATVPKHLSQVRIAGDGALSGAGIFSFDEMLLEEGELEPGQLVGSGEIVKRTVGSASIRADLRSTFDGEVVVEEGRLFAAGLPQATYTVRGGSLHLPSGANNVELAGGDLLASSGFLGNILVSTNARITTDELSGILTGTGNLTFGSQVRFDDEQTMRITGESPSFSGSVVIDSVTVAVLHENSLGMGDITIQPGGRLQLALGQDDFDLSNDVHLRGGEIRGFDSVRRPQQLLGNLFVAGHSLTSEMNVVGTTHLAEGSRLTTFGDGVMQFLGNMKIGGRAELEYGLTRIVTNAADIDVGTIQLLGTISSDADNAVLNLVDRGLDEIVLDASYHVATGQTLQVLQNGLPLELTIDGTNNTLTGGGTLLNPVEFADGATISPGDSPGTLSLGSSTTLGPEAIYEWEINDALGEAGQDVGWDLLQVAGELVFEAIEQDPFLLQVIGLGMTGQEGSVENFDPNQNYQWLIASADSIVGFDPAIVQIDALSFLNNNALLPQSRLFLQTNGGNLFLVHQVPEPNSSVLILGIFTFDILIRRRGHAV